MSQGLESLPIIGESSIAALLEWVPLIDTLETVSYTHLTLPTKRIV